MTTTLREPVTAADVLDDLSGTPVSRWIMTPPPGQATEADAQRLLVSPRKRICELIDGTRVEQAMGLKESPLATRLIVRLDAFVFPRKPGLVTAPDGAVRLWAGRVRVPDVARQG